MNYSSGLGLAITTINFDNKCIFPLGKTFFFTWKSTYILQVDLDLPPRQSIWIINVFFEDA